MDNICNVRGEMGPSAHTEASAGMTREKVNLVSPCVEIIGQVSSSDIGGGWNLSKILEATKKKGAVCSVRISV